MRTGVGWGGVIMALLVGMSFAANSSLAAVAYTGGATPIAVLLSRTGTALVVLLLLLGIQGAKVTVPKQRRWGASVAGLFFASYAFCVMFSIQYLPVGVVIATFYVFPILIAVIEWLSGRHAFNFRTVAALGLAFMGIVLAQNVFGATWHGLGIALCLFGAISVTIVIIISSRLASGTDSRPLTLHMLAIAMAIFVVTAVVYGDVRLPGTSFAWFGFIGGPVFYTFAVITLFVVNSKIGPVKTSLIMNIEPVTSVILGYLLLDQNLRPIQLTGIALVISAVLLVEIGQRSPTKS